jgi:hypothetical protein
MVNKITLRFLTDAVTFSVTAFGLIWLLLEVASWFLDLSAFQQLGGWGFLLMLLLSLLIGNWVAVVRLLKVLKIEWQKGNANVEFWHSDIERQAKNKDVRGMISSVKRQLFISGISLRYIVDRCKKELTEALDRGARVEIVIAANDEQMIEFYSRFSKFAKDNIVYAHKAYQDFFNALPDERKPLMKVYGTTIPLTHSIGFYDDLIFVSELCLFSYAPYVPSYCLTPASSSYKVFKNEMEILLSGSNIIVGDKPKIEEVHKKS